MIGQQVEVAEPGNDIESSRMPVEERFIGPCGCGETALNEIVIGKCLIDAGTAV